MDSELVRWFYTIAALLVVGALGLILMELMRINWSRVGRNFIRVNIRTPIGRMEHQLAKRDSEVLKVTGSDNKPFEYIIVKEATYDDEYPQSMPSWLRTRIPTLDYYEGYAYPLFGRNVKVLEEMKKLPAGDSRYIALLGDKRNLEAQNKNLSDAAGGRQSSMMPVLMLVLSVACIVFSMAGAYFAYSSVATITDVGIKLGVISAPVAPQPKK